MTQGEPTPESPPPGNRLPRYLALDRGSQAEGSHPAVRTLIRRPRPAGGANRRLAEFLRIARGREA